MRDTETVTGPDINNPKDGNKIVSPNNLHTDPVATKVDPDDVKVEPAKVETKEAPKETPAPVPTPAPATPAPAALVASVVFPVKTEDKPNE